MADAHDTHESEVVLPEPDKGELWGMMGLFDTPADLYHAAEELRDAGYKGLDAMTPFPVHGLERALGLKPTPLPFLVLGGGAAGLASGIALTWYVNYDYALNISGKVPFSWHIYIPVYFELTVLLSALTCFFATWALCKLPTFFHPTMRHKSFPRTTDDGFFLTVDATDPKYDSASTRKLLEKLGAKEVEEVHS
ncbi:MAG: DUF3341 domain-containing protein [Polyangiaceae bacterium]|jgi:hypothetical protein|nr:DUF3341 domain-containing protein [Polyangiaceae bacterium]MBK8941099.1 DUF3341 domain-containing protein [Polyangiaceae bacterium]